MFVCLRIRDCRRVFLLVLLNIRRDEDLHVVLNDKPSIYFAIIAKENHFEILEHEDLPDVLVIPHKGPRPMKKVMVYIQFIEKLTCR